MASPLTQATAAGVTDTEIRIGNIMPYTGPLTAFAAIGRAEAAYFDMVNERGGINGRKIKFITRDDSSNPVTAAEETRNLVEEQNVLLMFGSFGTPDNLATRKYLNEKNIPQLFVASGDEEWAHPKKYPWTMGWQPTFRSEGRIYANYIQASYGTARLRCCGRTTSSAVTCSGDCRRASVSPPTTSWPTSPSRPTCRSTPRSIS